MEDDISDGYIEIPTLKSRPLVVEIGEDELTTEVLAYAKDREENHCTKSLNWFQWIWYKHKVRKEVQRLLKGGKF